MLNNVIRTVSLLLARLPSQLEKLWIVVFLLI